MIGKWYQEQLDAINVNGKEMDADGNIKITAKDIPVSADDSSKDLSECLDEKADKIELKTELTFSFYELGMITPTEEQKSAEYEKFNTLIGMWADDPELDKVSVRVKYLDGNIEVICPAFVSVYDQNTCNITFSNNISGHNPASMLMTIAFDNRKAEKITYSSSPRAEIIFNEESHGAPSAAAITSWADSKFAPKGSGGTSNVNPVPKTDEMTAEVGIDEDGKLWFDPRAWEDLAITSFSVTPSGFVEKGAAVDNITVSWKANKKDVTAELDLLWDVWSADCIRGRFDPEDGAAEKTYTFEGVNVPYDKDQNLRVVLAVYRQGGKRLLRSKAIEYANRIFLGTAAIPAYIGSAFIRSLEKSKLSAARSMTETVTAGEGEYIWYACPAAGYGTPSFKLGNPFEGGAEKAGEIMFTNASGYSEAYQVWRSVNSGLGTMKVEVI